MIEGACFRRTTNNYGRGKIAKRPSQPVCIGTVRCSISHAMALLRASMQYIGKAYVASRQFRCPATERWRPSDLAGVVTTLRTTNA